MQTKIKALKTLHDTLPRRGWNPQPPGLLSDAHPTEPPRPAIWGGIISLNQPAYNVTRALVDCFTITLITAQKNSTIKITQNKDHSTIKTSFCQYQMYFFFFFVFLFFLLFYIAPDKSGYPHYIFLISPQKYVDTH